MNRIARTLAAVLALVVGSGVVVAAPKPVDAPSLPSADRIAPWIHQRLGDDASADIRLCIAPDGHVTSVGIVKTSSYDAFDRAIIKDIASWKFAATDSYRCTRTTIDYHTH